GCRTNFPLLLKNFLKSLTSIAYSSSLLFEEDASSSLKTCLAFKARDFYFSLLFLALSKSFSNTTSQTLRFPTRSSRDSFDKSLDSSIADTFVSHLEGRALNE
ncbi:hypothetical protein Tco_1442729, partial [Tanacetum coccineum]